MLVGWRGEGSDGGDTPLTRPCPSVTGCSEVQGCGAGPEAEGGGVYGGELGVGVGVPAEGGRAGMTIWLSCSVHTHSHSVPRTRTDVSMTVSQRSHC